MYLSKKNMDEQVGLSYDTAKRFLLDILENNDFSKDKDIIRTLSSVMQKEDTVISCQADLSKLIVDKDCRLFLPDYSPDEIEMPYLVKTVFIFFLFHPEGVEFKNMSNHMRELYDIYQEVSLERNTGADKMKYSIRNMVEPINNRIYETCSNIRKALSKVVRTEVLEQYCIVGKQRGKQHKIMIDRDLLCIENDKLIKIKSNYEST